MSRKKAEPARPAQLEKRTQFWESWAKKAERWAPWLAVALVAIGTVRIVTTYAVFNHTIDEPAHVACGMEWLDKGTFTYETMHPPLPRVMTALGLYLTGVRTAGREGMYPEGGALLYGNNGEPYDRRLALARLGILPFFWIASAVVYLWSSRWFGRVTALTAVLLFTFLPAILAHSGLATTDMALTAMLGAALLSLIRLCEKPSLIRGLLLGFCGGLAILSKLTSMPYFVACAAMMLVVYAARIRPGIPALAAAAKKLILPLAVAVPVLVLTVWAGYRFSIGPSGIPAPSFFNGIEMVRNQVNTGHPSYLLGERSVQGFWYYYPVALAVKLPFAFLALAVWGAVMCWRKAEPRYWMPLALTAGLLGFALPNTINIGIRHVMPVLMFLSMVAAVAVVELARRAPRWMPRIALGLIVWMTISSAASHPDYLAYFNFLAGDKPEEILVDSDLDWGQDMKRLSAKLKEVGAQQVYFNPLVLAHLELVHGFPPIQPTPVDAPAPGWTAVSLTVLKTTRLGLFDRAPEIDPWPNGMEPLMRVGKGVYLYHFVPQPEPGRR